MPAVIVGAVKVGVETAGGVLSGVAMLSQPMSIKDKIATTRHVRSQPAMCLALSI
jgi:hypothetical protein